VSGESVADELAASIRKLENVAPGESAAELAASIRKLEADLARLLQRTDELERTLTAITTPPPPPPPPEPSIGEAWGAFTLDGILSGETSLGDAICDVSAYYVRIESLYQQHVDFAFHNGGLLQAGLDEGPVTEKEIIAILPKDIYLVYGSIRGSDLIKLVKEIPSIPQGDPLFIQVSDDVKYTIDYTNGTLSNLTIGGTPVDPIRYYAFVTNVDLFNSAPAEIQALTLNTKFTTYTLTDVVFDAIWFIGEQGWSLFPYIDGRISVVGGR
jgi:5'-nucleotidase/UDP-sugar diphosphatase